MAAPTSLAETFNKTLANREPSTHGTRRKQRIGLLVQPERTFRKSRGALSSAVNSSDLGNSFPPEFDARSGASRGLPKLGGYGAQRLLEGTGRLAARDQPCAVDDDGRD